MYTMLREIPGTVFAIILVIVVVVVITTRPVSHHTQVQERFDKLY